MPDPATILLTAFAFFVPTNLALWFFGVRPYLQQNGRTPVTAINWSLSIWADLTTAYELGRQKGHFPLCVKWLFALQLVQILVFLLIAANLILG